MATSSPWQSRHVGARAALFAIRTRGDEPRLCIDALTSSAEHPGFQVLIDDAPHEVVVGAIGKVWHVDIPFEHVANAAAFAAFDTPDFVKVAWAVRLEPLGDHGTHVTLEVRVDATSEGAWRKFRRYFRVIGPGSHFIRRSVLAAVARDVGTPDRDAHADGWHDVVSGIGGAAIMLAAILTPFMRRARNHWGIDESAAARTYPGDDIVAAPRWSWTHGIEIDAPSEQVWPWVAQIGADHAGFYSYQWLENVIGCHVRGAETVHPEWAVREGGTLSLHPKGPPFSVAALEPGRYFVVRSPAADRASAKWVETTWLFFIEPLGADRCRFISRFRCACSDDFVTRLEFGAPLMEPIGFAMDRRMLKGVRDHAVAHR